MSLSLVILDTGPLVSFLARGSQLHEWTSVQWKLVRAPMLTCEPVLTEAAFLLRREGRDLEPLFELLDRGVIRVAIDVQDERRILRELLVKYRSLPMSLADSCLVRLSELHPGARVLTLDSDFRIYRRRSGKPVPVLMPDP